MFKSNFLSIFGGGSASKSKVRHTKPDSSDIPRAFTINNDKNVGTKSQGKLLNISMDNDLDGDFVNINMNEMTYAEVANLNGHSQTGNTIKSIKPVEIKIKNTHKSRSSAKGFDDDELEDSIHEKFKSDIHYKKHKQFKANEKKKNKKKRN